MTPAGLDAVLFYLFAALAVAAALVMVSQRNPTYSAFSLIVTIISLSAIFGLLGSPFIAVLQIVVYAGAIMVLFLFTLMLLSVKSEDPVDVGRPRNLRVAAVILGAALVVQMAVVFLKVPVVAAPVFDASARPVAHLLFHAKYLYVFEATSILILAALVGAVVLAKKDWTP